MTEAGAALRTILEHDAGFATDPVRLERAVGDLLPYDERAARLVAVAAAVGVPELVAAGRDAEAREALVERGGLRPEVAAWAVGVWHEATGGRARAAGALPRPERAVHAAAEHPGAPTSLRLAVHPGRHLLVAVVSSEGVFAAVVREHAPPSWRRVANPVAPASRDAVLTWDDDEAVVAWTDQDGVHARALAVEADGELALGAPRHVLAGRPARYPLAVDGRVGLLWTGDRTALHRTVLHGWVAEPDEDRLPALEPDTERFTGLDVVPDGEDVWLLATTDRERALLTRWGDGRWVPVSVPGGVAAATAVRLRGECVIVAAGAGGELFAATAGDSPGWTAVRHEHQGRKRLLASAARDGAGWLGYVDERGTWLARLGRRGGEIMLGPASRLRH